MRMKVFQYPVQVILQGLRFIENISIETLQDVFSKALLHGSLQEVRIVDVPTAILPAGMEVSFKRERYGDIGKIIHLLSPRA